MLTATQKAKLNAAGVVEQSVGLGDLLDLAGNYWPTTDLFIDSTNGNDAWSGLSWSEAKATFMGTDGVMALAIATAAKSGQGRGRVRIFVAPGGYTEDIITPSNTECPFGQLIAVNPTGQSFGAVYLTSETATEPVLTIRARGWKVSGFEFDGPATDGCVLLDGLTANSNAAGTEISDCLFVGQGQADFGIDVLNNGAPHTIIRNCHFDGITGPAITCTNSSVDQPRFWEIDHCVFVDNDDHIDMNGKGFKESWIHDCSFMKVGANRTATLQLDNQAGSNNNIGPNNFLSSTYDNAGGYYTGTNDFWYGNASEDGFTTAAPAA
jgi:hypothetical protein